MKLDTSVPPWNYCDRVWNHLAKSPHATASLVHICALNAPITLHRHILNLKSISHLSQKNKYDISSQQVTLCGWAVSRGTVSVALITGSYNRTLRDKDMWISGSWSLSFGSCHQHIKDNVSHMTNISDTLRGSICSRVKTPPIMWVVLDDSFMQIII